jgi:hypothetical protein
MPTSDLQTVFEAKKDDMLELIKQALKTVGLDELHLKSIHLNVKKAPVCPPGTTAVYEAVQHPNGSVSYQLVCK